MATVADIEPASLALTPGQAEVFTLRVRNDGEEVEAYRLTAVDDAEDHVVIDPETLLVHPGETGTAIATITLEHTGGWSVGDLIVRFHIVPTVNPDDFVVVEAIATIQSFSDVAALVSPTSLRGRRGDAAEIAIANAGNVHVYADVAVSAGELAVVIDRPRVALPAGGTETVDLGVRVNRLLWRGEPVPHPFTITIMPEGASAISLEGTFAQLPVFPGWALKTAIGAGAALALGLVVWLAALAWGNVGGAPAAETASASPSQTPAPQPVDVAVAFDVEDEDGRAGDPAVVVLGVEVQGATDDALAAVAVEWPEELALVDSTCEGWVGAEIDRRLQGEPRSGDECLIDPSRSRSEAELTFATPAGGFSGSVSGSASRVVTIEDAAEVVELDAPQDLGEDEVAIELEPYPFWMEVAIAEPPTADDPSGVASITVHRTVRGDGTDEPARMAFELALPGFVDPTDQMGICDGYDADGAVCILDFPVRPNWPVDLAEWTVTVPFEIGDGSPYAGVVSARPVALSVAEDSVAADDVAESIRGAETPLIAADGLFPVAVELDPGEAGAGDVVTATVEVTGEGFPAEVDAFQDGSWVLGLDLTWPDALRLTGEPRGCAAFAGGVCEIPGPEPGQRAVITLSFTVADDAFENGEVTARGVSLSYDPTTDADELDERERPAIAYPTEWIGSDAETFFPF